MKTLLLSAAMPSGSLSGYTAAVTFLLLGLMFYSLFLGAKDLQLYCRYREPPLRNNGLIWIAGAAMNLFTLLFVLMRRGWLMGVVLLIGFVLLYSTVGDGVREQLKKY